ncbi:SGNH/GDSL hydrolase family protein [Butyrivibrio sp. AE2032]|uniref:SGNH/GDSL hydrolase family protein n=1 Tax=Butyrivibrio sp. AE2032 TaxID=1458463 RepID=UPI00055235FC|nr:SGNH/GDSL hydrolase family protein [Butyrivibrio sp. AE2032]
MNRFIKRAVSGLLVMAMFIMFFNVSDQTCYAANKNKTITIKCIGDSVTEGIKMEDARTAVLGGSTYPSVLYTLLTNNGYDVVVNNEGHGGETTASIVARLGGVNLLLGQDLFFDSNNCAGPIDNRIIAGFGPNLLVPITFPYYFSTVNPLIINGKQYVAKTDFSSEQTYLYKTGNDDTVKISAGSSVKLSGNNKSDITIIFAGINDKKGVTLDAYVAMLKNGVAASGKKYIIVGPHSTIYEKEGFVVGNTTEERRENYRKRMIAEFGNHYIDLNTEWFERALPIAQDNGFLTGYSSEQINAIQSKLSNRIIPAEFTYNNQDYNVHLNRAGYTVVAHIIFERLKTLKYL